MWYYCYFPISWKREINCNIYSGTGMSLLHKFCKLWINSWLFSNTSGEKYIYNALKRMFSTRIWLRENKRHHIFSLTCLMFLYAGWIRTIAYFYACLLLSFFTIDLKHSWKLFYPLKHMWLRKSSYHWSYFPSLFHKMLVYLSSVICL